MMVVSKILASLIKSFLIFSQESAFSVKTLISFLAASSFSSRILFCSVIWSTSSLQTMKSVLSSAQAASFSSASASLLFRPVIAVSLALSSSSFPSISLEHYFDFALSASWEASSPD